MAVFEYQALDNSGKQQKGTKEGDSARQIRQWLREQQLTPIFIEKVHEKQTVDASQSLYIPFIHRKLSASQLALITRQLATLVQAAMPIEESLNAVAAQQEKIWIKNILLAVRSKIMEGFTFAKSLDVFPQHFPHMYRATVSAGEHSGNLDQILSRLADHTEKNMQSRQKVQLAMLYPIILFVVAISIVSFLLGYVVPDIIKIFVDSGQKLPTITRILVSASEGFQKWWPWMLSGLFFTMFIIMKTLAIPKIRMKWHTKLLSFPVFGSFSKAINTSRFAGTLSILTRSGVSLVDALNIAAKVVSNERIKEGIMETARSVSEGSSLYRSLKRCGFFSPMMLHMISSGESTGELDNMLKKTADNQQFELENKIAIILGLFEPLMLALMGGIILLIVLAILLPILNMNNLVA